MASLDPMKAKQAERLGMGLSRTRYESITSSMRMNLNSSMRMNLNSSMRMSLIVA